MMRDDPWVDIIKLKVFREQQHLSLIKVYRVEVLLTLI